MLSDLQPFDETLTADREYWQKQLAGVTRGTELPLDFPRPNRSAAGYEETTIEIHAEIAARLRSASQGRPMLAFSVFAAALWVLLHEHGATDVVVAAPAHRPEREAARFGRAILLRCGIGTRDSGRRVLDGVRAAMKGAYAHQRLGCRQLPALLGLAATAADDLARIVMRYEGLHDRHDALKLHPDLVFNVGVPEHGPGTLSLQYDAGLFRPRTIALIARRYAQVLEALLTQPDATVIEIGRLPRAESLDATNRDSSERVAAAPAEQTVDALFEQQAARTPFAVALVSASETLTYEELNRRANRIAWGLRTHGCDRGARVGLFLRHSADLVAAVLGVLKAGAAYVPIDPHQGALRVRALAERAGLRAVLLQHDLRAAWPLPAEQCQTWCIDAGPDRPSWNRDDAPERTTGSGDLAYVMFTSGSTGIPKGVMIPHGALVNYSSWAAEAYFEGQPLSVALYSSIGFDLTVTSMFPPLLSGGRILVGARPVAGASMQDTLRDLDPDILKLTPSHLLELKDADNRGRSTRTLIVGGEPLDTETARQTIASFGRDVRIVNEYGPTEATVGCTVHRFDEHDDRSSVPIGRPAAHARIYLLDRELGPVADHVIGDVYIAGPGLATGYLDDAALTAARFLPDPFVAGARMYASGDLARRLPDGVLEFLGRKDDQVKYHGVRLELGEIAAALNRHPRVRGSAVVPCRDEEGAVILVAHYAARREIDARELRAWVEERLSPETVPNLFVHLPKLPLTINGKLDRSALPTLTQVRRRLDSSTAPPRNATEAALAEAWAEVLGLKQVGIHDNFFELGGDSILSLQLVAKARRRGVHVLPADVFEHQTVALLALHAGKVTPRAQAAVIDTADVPLTPIQQWFFEQDPREPHHFTQSVLLVLRRPPRLAVLDRLCRELLARHDALRFRFVNTAGRWQQERTEWKDQPVLRTVDLSRLHASERSHALSRVAARVQASLSLERGLLFRAIWFEMGGGDGVRLLLVAHHLVVDGVSWNVLLNEMEEGLRDPDRAAAVGPANDSDGISSTFQEWSRWLSAEARSGATRSELPAWLDRLRAGTVRLPLDGVEDGNTIGAARRYTCSLSREQTIALLRDRPRERATAHEILLAALATALGEWARQSVVIDVERHGRESLSGALDVSRTVGWFTCLAPFALPYEENASADAWLDRTKDSVRGIPRGGLGYGLLRFLNPETRARLATQPAPSVSFNYRGQVDAVLAGTSPFALAPERLGPGRSSSASRTHLLDIEALIVHGQLRVDWTYHGKAWREETIARVASRFRAALEALLVTTSHHPDTTVSVAAGKFATGEQSGERLPLTPMQQAMLVHAVEPGGAYVIQFRATLDAPVDLTRFKRAWQIVIARHDVLRTRFEWNGTETPRQIVESGAEARWDEEDWRHVGPAQQQTRLDRLARDRRAAGVDVSKAPLLDLVLRRLGSERYAFLCTSHHLILDGWSTQILLRDVLSTYERFVGSESAAEDAPPEPGFSRYVRWLIHQDRDRARAYWRKHLHGVAAPAVLRATSAATSADVVKRQTMRLSAEGTDALEAFARGARVTLNTVVQGVWAQLVGRHTGAREVTFGVTVSGRPSDLPNMERIVGPFINTLPVRIALDPDAAMAQWLQRLQAMQVEMRRYEYSALPEILSACDLPPGTSLFDTIVVFENYPTDRRLAVDARVRGVTEFEIVSSGDALTLVATPGEQLVLELWDERPDSPGLPGNVCSNLEHLLFYIGAHPEANCSEAGRALDRHERQVLAQQAGQLHAQRRRWLER